MHTVLATVLSLCISWFCIARSEFWPTGKSQLQYAGHLLEAPVSYFSAFHNSSTHNRDRKLTTNLFTLYASLGLVGSTVIDVFSGWGASYFPLAKAIGPTGSIAAIEIDQLSFNCFKNNTIDKDTWDRTLVMHVDPCERELGRRSSHSISNLIGTIGLDCPRLIRINDHVTSKEFDAFHALIGGISLINLCRPLVLIDCRVDDPATATAILELISLLGDGTDSGGYDMYWVDTEQTLTESSVNGDEMSSKRTTPSLLAIPSEMRLDVSILGAVSVREVRQLDTSTSELSHMWDDVVTHFKQPKYASVEHASWNIHSDERKVWFAGEASHSTQLQTATENVTLREESEVTVHLRDITHLESPLEALLGFSSSQLTPLQASLRASLASAGLDTMSVMYLFSSQASVNLENLEKVSEVHCSVWLYRLTTDATLAQSGVMYEASPFAEACSAFLSKRLRTLRRIFALRALTLQYPDLVLDPTGKASMFVEMFPDAHRDVQTGSAPFYYQLSEILESNEAVRRSKLISPSEAMTTWFERGPFSAKSDEAACGEPIWCGHTAEMQRRIHAWQNPEERGITSKLPSSDWSTSTTRSCTSSKFLVYEPSSDKHGIGALLELIAVAFRYAVCLDRILVLNTLDQQPTLLKWIHPGCQGSVFECYFQPIGSCTLSAAEIAAAPSSKDGFEFDKYPQREARVLVLKGMPLEGKCTLCYSNWPAESRFFDGLYLNGGSFNGSDKNHLKHSAAFRSSVKATWASQFLRYMMRPRPWLQEVVAQIVQYSMQSPASPAEMVNIKNQSYLRVNSFPQRYLSLHVRFGMKAAEATLEPLTRYMEFIVRKLPHMRDIFLSTETEAVVGTLRAEYPEHRFHVLRYPRKEFLDLGLRYPHLAYHQSTDFVDEMLFSLANLYVASEAHAFVGTLSSNWCVMIMHLERTRGDGGYEYFSMDQGSAHTSCF